MGVVASIVSIKYNLEDQGMAWMFLGYSQNYMGGTYSMMNICKNIIVTSRDVIWIDKTYG